MSLHMQNKTGTQVVYFPSTVESESYTFYCRQHRNSLQLTVKMFSAIL